MNKIDEMKQDLYSLKDEAQELLNLNKVQEAEQKMKEMKNLKSKIEIQEQLDKEEKKDLLERANRQNAESQNKTEENANAIRAMIKKVTNKPLTQAENALLLPTESNGNGEHGEGYIIPEDVRTLITKKMRQYKSMRDVIGYYPSSTLSGSFPIENFETVSELIDFTDGTEGSFSNDISFKNVTYSLKEKGALLPLSNTLLNLTDNNLISYIAEVFSKKAVITENKMCIEKLKTNKTVKQLADWKALKSSLNVDLDPSALYGTVIVTNQDGFNFLDEALDDTGRPILQVNPTDATKKTFAGYEIIVYSNSMLETKDGKIPIFYGNLKEAVKIVDLSGKTSFATSSEAGFTSNITIARLIEFIDVIQVDSSDKCYIYGEFSQIQPTSSAK